MSKLTQIMFEPCSIFERYEHAIKLIINAYERYNGMIFTVNDVFRLVMNVHFDEQYYVPRTGGSIIKMPDGMKYPEDQYIKRSGDEFRDFYMINTLTRYFNWCLSESERAAVFTKDFSELTDLKWKDVCNQYGISTKTYYKLYEIGREKLIEAWALDEYGGPEDDYDSFLGMAYVCWKREQRTGIPGGYMNEHPEWMYMFLDKGATMTTPGECYWRVNEIGGETPPHKKSLYKKH